LRESFTLRDDRTSEGGHAFHEGYLWVGKQTCVTGNFTDKDETISFLPLCHVYEQVFALMLHVTVGHIVNFTESTDTIMKDLRDVSPTVFHAVPRIWEKIHSGIVLKMQDATWLKRKVFKMALSIGATHNEKKLSGETCPLSSRLGYVLAYFVVFWKLKERLGLDRIRLGNSAAAPISHNILKFFQSIGVPIREGFGMTETTGTTCISDEYSFKLGTVGKPLPETDVKIAEDGEILFRNKGLFKGYYRDEQSTREALIDGWLHTGDVGEIDEEGYLKITGRKKDLIITAGGRISLPNI